MQISDCCGLGGKEEFLRAMWKLLEMMGMFTILVVVIVFMMHLCQNLSICAIYCMSISIKLFVFQKNSL